MVSHSYVRPVCATLLWIGLASSALAQVGHGTSLASTGNELASSSVSFASLEGKWVRYAGSFPIRILILTRESKPHAQFVSQKSGESIDCTNVHYENGELSFDLPGNPVPKFNVRLAPGGAMLIGEMIIPGAPFPIPVNMERVDAWPTPEEIAARGPAGPTTVRGVIP